MLFIIYILTALFVAWLGRNTQIGAVGFFIVAMIVSPLIGLLILMIAHNRSPQTPV